MKFKQRVFKALVRLYCVARKHSTKKEFISSAYYFKSVIKTLSRTLAVTYVYANIRLQRYTIF